MSQALGQAREPSYSLNCLHRSWCSWCSAVLEHLHQGHCSHGFLIFPHHHCQLRPALRHHSVRAARRALDCLQEREVNRHQVVCGRNVQHRVPRSHRVRVHRGEHQRPLGHPFPVPRLVCRLQQTVRRANATLDARPCAVSFAVRFDKSFPVPLSGGTPLSAPRSPAP